MPYLRRGEAGTVPTMEAGAGTVLGCIYREQRQLVTRLPFDAGQISIFCGLAPDLRNGQALNPIGVPGRRGLLDLRNAIRFAPPNRGGRADQP